MTELLLKYIDKDQHESIKAVVEPTKKAAQRHGLANNSESNLICIQRNHVDISLTFSMPGLVARTSFLMVAHLLGAKSVEAQPQKFTQEQQTFMTNFVDDLAL